MSVLVCASTCASANPALDFILSSKGQQAPRGQEASAATARSDDAAPRLLKEARRSLGLGHRALGVHGSLWCAEAVNLWLGRSGHTPTHSRLARDMIKAGTRVSKPQPGAIAIFRRGRGGGHVAIVDKIVPGGYTAVSPNYGGRVALAHYRDGSAIAFIVPSS